MRDFFILSKALLKNTYSFRHHRLRNLLLGLVLILSFSPILALLYVNSLLIFKDTYLGLMYLQAYFVLINILLIWTTIFVFPSTFYFANDVPRLITLPIPSWVIVAGKTLQVYCSSFILSFFGLLPIWISFVQTKANIGAALIFLAQIVFNSLPTLFIIGIATILVMRFIPFFQNKDRFMLIIGILSVVFGVGIGLASQTFASSTDELLKNLLQKNPVLLGNALKIFFFVPSISQSIWKADLLQFGLSIGIILVLGILFLVLAQHLYLPAALSMQANQSRKAKKKPLKAASPIKGYIQAEFKMLLRTPAYLTNCVLASFIAPLMVVVVFLINPEIRPILAIAKNLDLSKLFDPIPSFFLIGGITGFFFGSMNGISATSFSRQGRDLNFIKYIPMSMASQISAKLVIGIFFSLLSTLLLLIPAHYLLTYPLYYDLAFLAGGLLSTLLVNQIALLIDGLHPKINWENETAAIKNNLNVLAELSLSWLIMGVLAALFFLIHPLVLYLFVVIVFVVGFSLLLYFITPKLVMRHLMKL